MGGGEVALHQVVAGLGVGVAAGTAPAFAPVDPGDAGLAHEPLHPLAGAAQALAEAQLGVDPR